MLQKILTICFYLLFFLTPLLWTPWNFELFEYNKMMFVYFLTIIITCCFILQMIRQKRLLLKRTPLDLPLLVFLLANILSTIFSIDQHISIWGYYSRLNGGLLSLISYLILYYVLVASFNGQQVINFLKAALLGGVLVSLWAIPEHFGISPSCVLLTGNFNASCWIQDVQARVFATLGQPNWLAGYLAMLIFPALYFLLTATSRLPFILYTLYFILFYLAFTFTYSRGATIGLLAGLLVFFGLPLALHLKGVKLNFLSYLRDVNVHIGCGMAILGSFLLINLLFGSALTNFKLLSQFAQPSRPAISLTASVGTQLENGGTESGAIRLIVWRGALDIFKHYPIFGSGVETFAHSYYLFRPQEHNLTSEWDFLYNKAHNEFLNYLATTGIGGFLAYLWLMGTFIFWSIKKIYNLQCTIYKEKSNYTLYILHCTLLASYISFLVQNFFLFSVVITALFFYLLPAFSFIINEATSPLVLPKQLSFLTNAIQHLVARSRTARILETGTVLLTILLVFTIFRFYWADTFFAKGMKFSEAGNPGKAYNQLSTALTLNPQEPYYRSELAFAAASAALALPKEDASLSSNLKELAQLQTQQVLQENPANLSYYRTAVRTYFMLSSLDKSSSDKTLAVLDQAIKMAPTDAKLTYNKALILGQLNRNEEAIKSLEKTVSLKPNYRDAYYSLGLFHFGEGNKEKAKEQMKAILKIIPNDPQALEKLKEWK